ncbi:MAG TPA: PAS domain S-box protein [Pyrinomonadaceae bacterium]|nr:PAS domain S-box protein [Pyrinomonadaceae bacterium]
MGRKSDDVTASPSELYSSSEEEGRRAEARAELDRVRREEQAQITNTLERITDGFISLDREWRYTYINRAGSVMANRPPEDFIGKNIWDVYPDAIGTAYETEYKRAMREQTPVGFEEYLPSADIWLEVNAYPSADGLSVFFRDVTERKRAEAALRASEERLRASEAQFRRMADSAPVMVWVTEADATCTYLSQSWYDFTGQTPETALGFGWLEATHPDDQQAAHDIFVRADEKHEAFRLEYRLRRKDGSYGWAIDSAKPRFGEDGEFLGYIGSVIDITDRRQAEQVLRESEEFNRSIMDGSADCVKVLDLNGRLLVMNAPGMCQMEIDDFGLVCGKEWSALWPDEARENIRRSMALAHAGETSSFEAFCPTAKGTPRWWDVTVSPVRAAPAGPVVRLLSVSRDITERKQAEKALRESEERYRLMTENAKDYAIIFLDTDARIKTWSVGAERILGWKEEEVVGQSGHIIFTPEDRQNGIPEKELSTAAAKGRASDERWHIRKDGSRLFGSGEMIGLFDEGGELRGFAKIFRDLTERKRMDDALRESEEKFRNLANSISQFAWMADAAGDVFWYNQRWFDYTGTTLEEMRGWDWQKFHHPEEVGRVVKSFKKSIATGEPWEDTFPLRSKTGEYRWFLSRALPIRDARGRITRWFGTNTDVEDLRQARKSAEEASRLKDVFLATVSHELRTPLTAVIGWTHILRAGRLDEAGAARALETVERNARAQNQLIEDLLDISRIITGKLRLDVRLIDPVGFLEAAIEAVHPAAEAKNVRLQKVLDTGVGAISGDADRLQQVVWNLLSNAIKFTPKGGRVQLRLERVNSHVEIIVADTGAGIEPEFLPFVFDRFRQADGSTTRAHGGLGLGLAIVRHLVELHGGTVHADSHGEGNGATFTVKLPLLPVYLRGDAQETRAHPRASSSLSSAESDERLDGVRLLVVDDEADTGEMLRAMLTERGAEVVVARSAEEALAEIGRSQFDVLISDIGMPGADGYELLSRVRNLPPGGGRRLPAIALTAYARTEDRLRALRAGYQMHVPKPVESAELIAVVSSLAARRKL